MGVLGGECCGVVPGEVAKELPGGVPGDCSRSNFWGIRPWGFLWLAGPFSTLVSRLKYPPYRETPVTRPLSHCVFRGAISTEKVA